jgi:secreted trypsin-like serine protease
MAMGSSGNVQRGMGAALVVCLSCGCTDEPQATTEHDLRVAEAHQPIISGAPAEGDGAVVGLVYELGSARALLCTGTLVAPRWVLTAAHCAVPLEPVAIAVGSSFDDAVEVGVQRIVLHPGFDADTLDHDLALLRLFADPDTAPLDLAPRDQPSTEGELVRLVGFGLTGEDEPRRKRHGTAQVTESEHHSFRVEAAPSLPCSGDSGGPAFATVDDRELLVGVLSSGDWECVDHGTYARVASYRDFLDEVTSDDEGSPAPGCALPRGGTSSRSPWLPLAAIAVLLARLASPARARIS